MPLEGWKRRRKSALSSLLQRLNSCVQVFLAHGSCRHLQTLHVGISGAVLTFPRLVHHLDGQRREVATTESESALADALTFGGDAVLLTEATYAYRS